MPSDNKYNPTIRTKLTPADHNFLRAAKDNLAAKFNPGPHSSREVLEAKAKTLAMTVHQHIQPILAAGGALKDSDLDALEATLFTMFLQGFDSTMFTKEEIINLCAIIHAQALRNSIEGDRMGKGTPDLLSGDPPLTPLG